MSSASCFQRMLTLVGLISALIKACHLANVFPKKPAFLHVPPAKLTLTIRCFLISLGSAGRSSIFYRMREMIGSDRSWVPCSGSELAGESEWTEHAMICGGSRSRRHFFRALLSGRLMSAHILSSVPKDKLHMATRWDGPKL